jgi:hypothetical protein
MRFFPAARPPRDVVLGLERRTFARSSRIESDGESSIQIGSPEVRRRLRQLAPVAGREARPRTLADVDPRLGADHAVGELLARHLEREDDDAVPRVLPALVRVARELSAARLRDVGGDVEDEARLAHAGARGDDREVPVVEAGGEWS